MQPPNPRADEKISVLTILLSTGLARSRHRRACQLMSGDHRPAGTRLRFVRTSPNHPRMDSRITYNCRPPRVCRRAVVREQGRCHLGSPLALLWEDWVALRLSDRKLRDHRHHRPHTSLLRLAWARLEIIARRRTMRRYCPVSALDQCLNTFPTSRRRRSRAVVHSGHLSFPQTGRQDGKERLR